jgi:hypothetical protein
MTFPIPMVSHSKDRWKVALPPFGDELLAVRVLNQMLELRRPTSVRIVWIQVGSGVLRPIRRSMQHRVSFLELPLDQIRERRLSFTESGAVTAC